MFNLIMIWYFIRKIVLFLEIIALKESDVEIYFYFFFNVFYDYGRKLLFYLEIERLVYWYWMGFLYDFI